MPDDLRTIAMVMSSAGASGSARTVRVSRSIAPGGSIATASDPCGASDTEELLQVRAPRGAVLLAPGAPRTIRYRIEAIAA